MQKHASRLILLGFLLGLGVAICWQQASPFGLSVDDVIDSYNQNHVVTAYNCVQVSDDIYSFLYKNMQLEGLMNISVKEQELGGHALVTYRERGEQYIITTWTKNKIDWYVRKIKVGKNLNDACKFVSPNYKFIKIYDINGTFINVRSRNSIESEA